MGTRSLTRILDDADREIICLYRQYDGYPSGMGQDLVDFLLPILLVNGLSLVEERPVANGMGCLAAQLVAHFKEEPGGIYLFPPGTTDVGEEYVYTIRDKGGFHIRAYNVWGETTLFDGPVRAWELAEINRADEAIQ